MEKYLFDIKIVGAGTAGCLLANRLTKNENLKVEKLLEFLEDLEDVQNVFSNQTLGRT